jgi:hypothetical protein
MEMMSLPSAVRPMIAKLQTAFPMGGLSRRSAIRGLALMLAGTAIAASPRSVAAEDAPLAIKGYDPVAYFTDDKPAKGLPEFEYQWDDYRWQFASASHREMFKADPVRYAPQFGNYCAMALSLGQVVVADPENWLISDGKLYVFGKPAPAGPVLFKKDLAENVVKANRNRPILPKQ